MRQQTSHGPFQITVSIAQDEPDNLNFLERAVRRLGPPQRTIAIANTAVLASVFLAMVWLVLWLFFLHDLMIRRFHLSFAEVFFLSLTGLVLMMIQLFAGSLRYAVASLEMKSIYAIAETASAEFFQAIGECVGVAVNRAMEGQEAAAPENPTLQ